MIRINLLTDILLSRAQVELNQLVRDAAKDTKVSSPDWWMIDRKRGITRKWCDIVFTAFVLWVVISRCQLIGLPMGLYSYLNMNQFNLVQTSVEQTLSDSTMAQASQVFSNVLNFSWIDSRAVCAGESLGDPLVNVRKPAPPPCEDKDDAFMTVKYRAFNVTTCNQSMPITTKSMPMPTIYCGNEIVAADCPQMCGMCVQPSCDECAGPFIKILEPSSAASERPDSGELPYMEGLRSLAEQAAAPLSFLSTDSVVYIGTACSALNTTLNGKIVLIDRGQCYFEDKSKNAKEAGAKGAIIMNTNGGAVAGHCIACSQPLIACDCFAGNFDGLMRMTCALQCGYAFIPTVFVTQTSGEFLIKHAVDGSLKLLAPHTGPKFPTGVSDSVTQQRRLSEQGFRMAAFFLAGYGYNAGCKPPMMEFQASHKRHGNTAATKARYHRYLSCVALVNGFPLHPTGWGFYLQMTSYKEQLDAERALFGLPNLTPMPGWQYIAREFNSSVAAGMWLFFSGISVGYDPCTQVAHSENGAVAFPLPDLVKRLMTLIRSSSTSRDQLVSIVQSFHTMIIKCLIRFPVHEVLATSTEDSVGLISRGVPNGSMLGGAFYEKVWTMLSQIKFVQNRTNSELNLGQKMLPSAVHWDGRVKQTSALRCSILHLHDVQRLPITGAIDTASLGSHERQFVQGMAQCLPTQEFDVIVTALGYALDMGILEELVRDVVRTQQVAEASPPLPSPRSPSRMLSSMHRRSPPDLNPLSDGELQ